MDPTSRAASSPDTSMVFIVLLNWNGIADTLGCLASLKKLDYASRQTVVVDNGSDDGSPARLKAEYPDVPLLEHRTNLGFTGGANAGIRYALARGADYIWLLNNDTLVEPHSLSALLAAANSDEAITLVSPLIYDYPDTRSLQFRGVFADLAGQGLIPALTLETPPPDAPVGKPLLLWGTALFMRATAIRRVGYFDERYFAYHEDLDYSLRTLAAGFRTVVEPRAVVYHKTPSSVKLESPFKAYLYSRNLLLFWSTHLDRLSRWTYRPKYLAWAISQASELRDAGNHAAADAFLDGAWSALRGRYGPPTKALPMPRALRHVVSSHPYLCIWLLTGQFQRILRALASRP